MSSCTTLDPRLVAALHWSAAHWEWLAMAAMALVIVALWRHGR